MRPGTRLPDPPLGPKDWSGDVQQSCYRSVTGSCTSGYCMHLHTVSLISGSQSSKPKDSSEAARLLVGVEPRSGHEVRLKRRRSPPHAGMHWEPGFVSSLVPKPSICCCHFSVSKSHNYFVNSQECKLGAITFWMMVHLHPNLHCMKMLKMIPLVSS